MTERSEMAAASEQPDEASERFGHVPGGLDASSREEQSASARSGATPKRFRAPYGRRPTSRSGPGRKRRPRRRKRILGALGLLLSLTFLGTLYAVAAPAAEEPETTTTETALDVSQGEQLYLSGCVSCHGINAQGVEDRGPTLIGVGSANVQFQMRTGRMPLAAQATQAEPKPTDYTQAEIDAIADYIQALGGGPEIPAGDLRDGDLALGGELFRLNCASCHNFAGRGAPLSAGKFAPNLADAEDEVIYSAMQVGPENMPVFGDTQLTPDEKKAIVNYVQTLKAEQDPGGANLGRLGPVPEGLLVWVVGITALVFIVMWIGARA